MLRGLLFLLLFQTSLLAQNLVSNGFFEESSNQKVIHKPLDDANDFNVPHWSPITGSTPDYFNDYTSTYYGYPIIRSIERGGRVGIDMYNPYNKIEGIQTKLKSPLVKGETYKISFTVAHCQYADLAVRQFPFLLTKEQVTPAEIKNDQSLEIQVIKLDTHIIYTDKWVKINGIYTAQGGEEFLTIMSTQFRFTEKKHISRILYQDASKILNKDMDRIAYYFFDNIEVIPVDKESNYCQEVNYISKSINPKVRKNTSKEPNVVEKKPDPTFIISEQIAAKLNTLKSKKVIHEDSPIEVNEFKDYTHHIFLFDVSGSMSNNISNSKKIFESIMASVGGNDVVTGIQFESTSKYLFQRQKKSPYILTTVNQLRANGGTTLENGLDLVNVAIRSDEKTKFHLITDVETATIDLLMTQYVYLKLKKFNTNQILHEFQYPVNDPAKDTVYRATDLYNEQAINNLPRNGKTVTITETITPEVMLEKIIFRAGEELIQIIFDPNKRAQIKKALNPTSPMEREVKGMFKDKSLNQDKSQIVFLSDCELEEDSSSSFQSKTFVQSENYVFLLDVSSSMRKDDKIDELKKSFLNFNERLSPNDRMSLVTFSSKTKLIIDRITAYESDTLKKVMRSINANGSTNIDKGLSYVYDYYANHENGQTVRLVLFTDGLFEVSSKVKRIIKSTPNIRLEIYQFGNEPNKEIAQLARDNQLAYKLIEKDKIQESIAQVAKKKDVDESSIYSEKIAWRTWGH